MTRLLLLLLLLAPGLASAQEAEAPPRATTERAILLWGPSAAVGQDAVARQALEQRLAPDQPFPSSIVRIADWLGAARFRLGGSAVSLPCAAAPSELVDPQAGQSEIVLLNQLGKQRLDDLDYPGALEAFQDAEARIPCQSGFVDTKDYRATYLYGGIAAFYAGQQKQATEWFRQATTIDQEASWDSSYPSEPQTTFLGAFQDRLARPKGRVFGDMRGTNYVEVRLDGNSLDLTKAFELTVLPGLHLIQAVDDRGAWSTWVRKVDEGGTLTFFSATGAEQMALDGPDGVLKNLAAADLTRRAQEQRLDDIYLVTLDDSGQQVDHVYAFSPEFQLWKRLERLDSGEIRTSTEKVEVDAAAALAAAPELTPEEKRKQSFLREADYRSGATFGFKYFSLWRCAADEADADGRCADGYLRQNDKLGGLITIDVRLYKGLALDIRFGATASDFTNGGNIFPEAAFGFRYHFLTGVVQPFLGGDGDIFFGTIKPSRFADAEVVVYGGMVGYGGVDFELPDGFRITLEGGGGVIIGGENQSDLNWPMAHAQFALGRFLP